jgi:membrane protease YdiL (CAAX protease family)
VRSTSRGEPERTRASARVDEPVSLVLTRPADSLAWMRIDLVQRLLPFAATIAVVWLVARPAWMGIVPGRLPAQLAFGLAGGAGGFAAACLLQRLLAPIRGSLRVPAGRADALLQAAYYLLNAPIEEAVFRGLVQGGLGTLIGPGPGLLAGVAGYVLYHRLGGWAWIDVAATALVGIPAALAFHLLPGPPSLLGVGLFHFGATCGFLGPGPGLLHRAGALSHLHARPGPHRARP